jgi:hypothetical protein
MLSGEPPAIEAKPPLPLSSQTASGWKHHLLPWALVLVGMGLRLTWPLDFEWKTDEKGILGIARQVARSECPWPWFGGRSSVGLDNPGFSIWPFAGLAYFLKSPQAMTLGIMVLNALALLGFVLWVWHAWPEDQRSLGYWAIALFAVSPLPVLFSRKLWAQDLLPVLLVPWMWSHAKRDHPLHGFLWGFWGILIGQLHLSGFFAGAGLALATWLTERKSVKWIPWLAGTAIGLLPLLPWASHLATTPEARPAAEKVVTLDLFFLLAFKNAWGVGLDYSLGEETGAFLRGPTVAGISTGLLRWSHLALIGLAVYGAYRLWLERNSLVVPPLLRLHFWGTLIGAGLFQLAGAHLHVHYLIVWSPVFSMAAAWVLYRRPRWLVAAALLQLFITASFLYYVHENGGVRRGDYGITYRRQIEDLPHEEKE